MHMQVQCFSTLYKMEKGEVKNDACIDKFTGFVANIMYCPIGLSVRNSLIISVLFS